VIDRLTTIQELLKDAQKLSSEVVLELGPHQPNTYYSGVATERAMRLCGELSRVCFDAISLKNYLKNHEI
jgi:hypothetical protein